MTRELSKAIMTKFKVKNSYVKWPSSENFVAYKETKDKCNSFTRKSKQKFFKEATKSGVMSNRTFWKTVKLFLTNEGCMTNDCISIEKDGDIVRDEKVLVELFNENYINIIEISSRNKPSSLVKILDRMMPLLTKLYQNTVFISASKKLKENFL